MKAPNKKIIIYSVIAFILLLISVTYVHKKLEKFETTGWSKTITPPTAYKTIDKQVKIDFLEGDTVEIKYKNLFKYFAQGANNYKSEHNALFYYPGAISSRGRQINALEGFARFFPLAASWLYAGNENLITFNNNESIDLKETLKAGLLAGTDNADLEYWGDIIDKDQRIVEAADIALGLWISKDYIWNTLTFEEKTQISLWLQQAINKNIVDNNWNLFPIIITKSLEALNFNTEQNLNYVNGLYVAYKKKHYLGNGWFDDPPKGVDYYNAWSIHYSLFWLDQIDPNFDHEFITTSHSEFLSFYKYLFSKNGFPFMGRSVCYRMAAPAPIVSGALLLPNEISPGFALNALDATWSFFIENNALEYGKVTQGFLEDDLSVLDNYSGAGSCLWSLRSLIVAFYVNKQIPLWNSEKEKLPIEISDFQIVQKNIGWRITGEKATNKISLHIDNNTNNKSYKLTKYGFENQFKEYIFKSPKRPKNEKALYKNQFYTTDNTLFQKN
ncbi:DUF2264 domain-containing protein [Formosa sp. PL04]|uniref:DUF2264 domain-containing protein n=1 Tax=Formosa sp. PL04 TaxID=3081755 RepID=UPI002982660C|nr:DUF2264 domain-containing protein [Formosa sp. PL04]MDW5289364.1 DUF2264 domain-containing protein [Formosa sp. PL04]